MKQLLANGSTLISAARRRGFAGRHDPWNTHGRQFISSDRVDGYDGTFTVMARFQLKSGVVYYYLMGGFVDAESADEFLANWYAFVPAGLSTPQFGEGYNYLARPATFDKWTQSQLDDYGVVA